MDIKNPKKGDRMAGFVRKYNRFRERGFRDDLILESSLRFELKHKKWRKELKAGTLTVFECTESEGDHDGRFHYHEYSDRMITIPGLWVPVFE